MNARVFAIGDIHGCFDALKSLIEQKINLTRNDKLILLGDYIDRGYQSKQVVDYIINLIEKGFDIVPLMGNHESMLLDALKNEDYLPNWIQNGGDDTMQSFGIQSLNELNSVYVSFFKGLKHYYPFDNFLFVHAGFNDSAENPFSDIYQMHWTRIQIYNHPLLKDKIIIHGHTPITEAQCQQLVNTRAQDINIDTGCVYSNQEGYGRLTALEIYSFKLFSV